MTTICKICGKEIVLESEPSDGQHVCCPYCNNKFSYGRSVPRPPLARFNCAICGREIEAETIPVDGQHVRCPYCYGKFSYGRPVSESSDNKPNVTTAVNIPRRNILIPQDSRMNIWDIIRAVVMVAILIVILVFLTLHYFKYDESLKAEEERKREADIAQRKLDEASSREAEERHRIDMEARKCELEELKARTERARREIEEIRIRTRDGHETPVGDSQAEEESINKRRQYLHEVEENEVKTAAVVDGAGSKRDDGVYDDSANGWTWQYVVASGEASILGGKKSHGESPTLRANSVVVPSSLGGAPVSDIGDRAFAGNDEIAAVIIPEGVKRIGDEAFSGCVALQRVTLPASLKEIGQEAFRECLALDDVKIPEGIGKIGSKAFWSPFGMSAMRKVSLSPRMGKVTVGANVFSDSTRVNVGDGGGGFFWREEGTGRFVDEPFQSDREMTVVLHKGNQPLDTHGMPESDDSTLGVFYSRKDAKDYFYDLLKDAEIGSHVVAPGSGRKVIWVRYYDAPPWIVWQSNTLGTVIPYPSSDFHVFKKFKYKEAGSSKWRQGKVVLVRVDIRNRSQELSEMSKNQAQTKLVKWGTTGKGDGGRPCRIPSLESTLRRRFGCGRVDYYNLKTGVMFVLYDCDESKDNPFVSCIDKRSQSPIVPR